VALEVDFAVTSGAAEGIGILEVTLTPSELQGAHPQNWTWDFGDGQQVTNGRPDLDPVSGVVTHLFTEPGLYDVTLVAEVLGAQDTVVKTDLVRIAASPEPWEVEAHLESQEFPGTTSAVDVEGDRMALASADSTAVQVFRILPDGSQILEAAIDPGFIGPFPMVPSDGRDHVPATSTSARGRALPRVSRSPPSPRAARPYRSP
jgi:PKD repeat protein